MVILEVPVKRKANEAGREKTYGRREREHSELPKGIVGVVRGQRAAAASRFINCILQERETTTKQQQQKMAK